MLTIWLAGLFFRESTLVCSPPGRPKVPYGSWSEEVLGLLGGMSGEACVDEIFARGLKSHKVRGGPESGSKLSFAYNAWSYGRASKKI